MAGITDYFLVVPAAGIGTRFHGKKPKQYSLINNLTVIEYTLNIFLNDEKIRKIIVVLAKDDSYFSKLAVANHPKITTVFGGNTRMDSVLAALNALNPHAKKNDYVLVHDAVRPLLRKMEVINLIQATGNHPVGGILALPVSDTIKQTRNGLNISIDRENFYLAQTPQLFRYGVLLEALEHAKSKNLIVTDEAMAVEQLAQTYILCMGSKYNLKITHPEDLIFAKLFIQQQGAII